MNYSIIADVGASIIKLLHESLVPEPVQNSDMIGLCSPYDKGDFVLCLHLYDIQESTEIRPVEMEIVTNDTMRYPPQCYTLHYMMTVISNEQVASRAINEQRIFGKALQTLSDNAILQSGKMVGVAADSREAVNIVLQNLSFEEKSKLWNFQNSPYRLSAFYKVEPVYIDSNRIRKAKRVTESSIHLHKKESGEWIS